MSAEIWGSIGLVFLFIIIGGIFAGTEIALVSLRESQIDQLARKGKRGQRAAKVARDPNRFLAAVQIGVTVAGFFSAAYGASAIAPALSPVFTGIGLGQQAADTLALVVLTLLIAYFSLVLGELVPKRLALQRASAISLAVAPPLGVFATIMKPAIAVLSASTNVIVRLFGADPNRTGEEMDEEELREVVVAHQGLGEEKREILSEVFAASDRTLAEVMQPRHAVVFLDADQTLEEAVSIVADQPYSRFPVREGSVDQILGFVHVRDLLRAAMNAQSTSVLVRDLVRQIVVLPGTNRLLPTIGIMQKERVHIGLVIDEYGGTDGIVTLEDLMEELVGEIHDEYDLDEELLLDVATQNGPYVVSGGTNLEEVEELTGLQLPEGSYETIGGFIMDHLDRVALPGDQITLSLEQLDWELQVLKTEGNRIVSIHLLPSPSTNEESENV